MLELRPVCENCGKELSPASTEAMICSFECTFCRDCATRVLADVCPNCGGGFTPRPIRPATNWNGDNYLAAFPASTMIRRRPVDAELHRRLRERIRDLPPEQR
jgi:uncharacterized protein